MRKFDKQHAQTAVELAVFGAILIFAMGGIIRGAVSRGNQQNAILRATRLALTWSYETSASMDVAARNSASVMVVEDRLTAGSGKYGPFDRSPLVMSGSGTHSANLFMPVDFGDAEDLGLFDLFVNGQHFSLSTSAFKVAHILPINGGCSEAILPWDSTSDDYFNGSVTPYRTASMTCPEQEPNCAGRRIVGPCANNAPRCAQVYPCANNFNLCAAGTCSDCSATSAETYVPCSDCSATSLETFEISEPISVGCAKLYTIVDNHPSSEKWCTADFSGGGTGRACPVACTDLIELGCNLSPDERFDLDRDGSTDVPDGYRTRFSWQWFLVMGYDEGEQAPPPENLTVPYGEVEYNGLLMAEGINVEGSQNIEVDVDGDMRLERVMDTTFVTGTGADENQGVILDVLVRDNQDGDVYFARGDDRDTNPQAGFLRDINIYTKVNPGDGTNGTYLRIEEGGLYSGGQFIRTTSKKDTIDLIERPFQLSNNTGRLCDGGSPNTILNPNIRRCGNCGSSANIGSTCYDPATKILFIRSAITGYQGHRWVTDRGTDPYVDFNIGQ